MEKKLEWNKQQNLKEENHETIHNMVFNMKYFDDNGPLFLKCRGKINGYRWEIKPSKIWENSKSYNSGLSLMVGFPKPTSSDSFTPARGSDS